MNDSNDITARRRIDWRAIVESVGPLVALVALVGITLLCEKLLGREANFLKLENLLNIMLQWSFVGMLALGMTVVIISGGIDLSVGSLLALSAGCGVWVMNTAVGAQALFDANAGAVKEYEQNLKDGFNVPLALPYGSAHMAVARFFQWLHVDGSPGWGVAIGFFTMVLVATLGGWLVGLLVARGRLAPFIATLGFLAIDRSLVMSLAEGGSISASVGAQFTQFGQGGVTVGHTVRNVPMLIGWPVFVFILMAVTIAYLLNRTRFGRYVYAIGSNERAAIYSAIRVQRVKLWIYLLMGLATGVAAMFQASYFTSVTSNSTGNLYELDAIAAVVIGGTSLAGGRGTVRGTIIGVLILGVISNMLNILDVSTYLQGTVKGAIIIAAALLQQVGRKN